MYYQPHSLKQTLKLLQEGPGVLLAGGSDLFPRFNGHLTDCNRIIDLSQLEELKKIEEDDTLSIGALVTHRMLQSHARIQSSYPSLAKAASLIGSPQIRSRGTIGGNLAHASPAADLPPVLMVLGAQVEVSSLKRRRSIPLEDLFLGPGETSLHQDEMITHIRLSPPEEDTHTLFHKVGRRKALSIAVLNMALSIRVVSRMIERLRIVVGSAAPIPLRISQVEERGEGEEMTTSLIDSLAQMVSMEIKPIDDLRASAWYRRVVARELVKDSLMTIFREV